MGGLEKAAAMISLAGKAAMVSGGASGIGLGTARLLAGVGAATALLDVDGARGEAAAAEIRGRGGVAEFYRCDVTAAAECERVVEEAVGKFGRLDILVNSAGVIRRRSVTRLTEEEWDLVVDVCLKGIFTLSRCVIPQMARSGGGSIVNIGSGWSLRGGPEAAAYCAAKGGVLNLTRAMAIDHGRQGIRVNCVCPGDVDTPMLRGEAEQLGVAIDEFLREAARRPLGRVGTPEDVARAVLFFASDMSAWVTGAHLAVDGGGTAS